VNQLIAIPSSQFVPDRVVYTAVEVLGGECDDCHPPTGRELWITDGTESGTTMLANLQPEDEEWVYSGTTYCCADFQGGEPRDLLKKGNTIWFSGNTAEYGRELYRYGLAAVGGGLFLVDDIVEGEGSSNPMYTPSLPDVIYIGLLLPSPSTISSTRNSPPPTAARPYRYNSLPYSAVFPLNQIVFPFFSKSLGSPPWKSAQQ
jgi:ELWxxDGT repeat protein